MLLRKILHCSVITIQNYFDVFLLYQVVITKLPSGWSTLTTDNVNPADTNSAVSVHTQLGPVDLHSEVITELIIVSGRSKQLQLSSKLILTWHFYENLWNQQDNITVFDIAVLPKLRSAHVTITTKHQWC